jgi:integrase
MKIYKRGKRGTYWIHTVINGQEIRQSLRTTDWRQATALAKKLISEAEQGKLTPASLDFAKLIFGEAADKYLAGRRLELAPSTYVKEEQLLVKLREFFQVIRLNRISSEQVLAYREWRSNQGVGPAIVNMEIGVLRRILKRAKRWHLVADDVKPLREPRTIGRAMTPEQKQKLLETAAQKPEWETAYCAAILALNTTMRGCELKGLIWADIDLFERTITIRKSKTAAGERIIPMTQEAHAILLRLYRRAELFGQVESSHYIFAGFRLVARFDGNQIEETRISQFDPTKPTTGWRTAWRKLTKQAGLPGLRFHDLRHHAITELAESGASEQTIMAIAGHVSRRMLERYSHVRLEAKRAALEALSNPLSGSYSTSHSTKGRESEVYSDVNPLFIESNGIGACGFEPQTPTVSR